MDNHTKRRVFLGIVIGVLVAIPFVTSLFRESTPAPMSRTEARRTPPKILKLEPANGKNNVKPGKIELRATFDRDMSNGIMWGACDEGEVAPLCSGVMKWEDKRTLLVTADLEPGTQYGVWLNKGNAVAFRGEGGVPLKPFHWTFKTSGERIIPKVAELKPENGATVEAGETELRVTFDQDMKDVAAWFGADEGQFPEYGNNEPRWLDKRTCVLKVKLEPGENYAIWFNKLPQFRRFVSEAGVPLEGFHWTFKTSGEKVIKPAPVSGTEAGRTFPKILKLEPASGASNVKPGKTECRITFNQDMSDGMTWGVCDNDEVTPPISGTLKWENKRTYLATSNLEPGTQYGVWLNKIDGTVKIIGFKNEAGVPSEPFHWTFKTSDEP